MVIILTTLIFRAQLISTDINVTTDLNKATSGVGLVRSRSDETRGKETSTRSINVGFGTEGNSILFRISNSIDVLFTTIVGLVTGARG